MLINVSTRRFGRPAAGRRHFGRQGAPAAQDH
jgi:hypothetical protein